LATALFFFLRKRKASGGKEKEEGIAMQSLKKREKNGNLPKPIALAIGYFSSLNPRAFLLLLREEKGF